MLKRIILPFLYCIFFPLFIIVVLFVIPEFSSLVSDHATPLARLFRLLITVWLMFAYISTGISMIPNLESSPIKIFNSWNIGYYNRFRNQNNDPRTDRSLFPIYYFMPASITCAFASLLFLLAISTFTESSLRLTIIIAITNFLLLFLPQIVLYNRVASALYGDALW